MHRPKRKRTKTKSHRFRRKRRTRLRTKIRTIVIIQPSKDPQSEQIESYLKNYEKELLSILSNLSENNELSSKLIKSFQNLAYRMSRNKIIV